MLVYFSYQKPIVKELQARGIEERIIQKYLWYVDKKRVVEKTGRTNGTHRDSQKTKTYKAEWAFERKNYTKIKMFGTIEEAQKRVNQITKSATWKKLCDEKSLNRGVGHKIISVEKSSKKGLAGQARGSQIILTDRGMDEYTLLHEMSHCLGNWHHDVTFRTDLLKLVSRFMGRDMAKALKSEFRAAKLPMRLNSKAKSFDEWYKGYERMEKAREAKDGS